MHWLVASEMHGVVDVIVTTCRFIAVVSGVVS